MIAKLMAILTSQETKDQIIERIKGNPKTSGLAVLLVAVWGAAGALYDKGMIVAASLCAGAGGIVAVAGLLFAMDGKPKELEPPKGPPQ